ncbi:hypothetical protein FRX31_024326 [Thalictrum thalictroides]|uniref:Uncharacterized protein n=1 Tax=Thalictrum thalictroides TaxID=46969 RepID=A0A7J6VN83_THATH|nr:hypothetical protein FRX31_024326 [Thalictrum thalictroides]
MMRAGGGGLVLSSSSSTNLKGSTSLLHSTHKLNKRFTISTTLLSIAHSKLSNFKQSRGINFNTRRCA